MTIENPVADNPIPESHVRLVATPTAGVPAEHSWYFRKIVSAGYKGFLQGGVAGATLYGTLGAVIGVIGAALVPGVGFIAVPILAGYGAIKGGSTFGQIGSNAAQLAEYAEMNERRNALLDRLYETKSTEEAQEIRKLLSADTIDKAPGKLIHWRTAIIGAILGAVAIGTLVYFGGTMLSGTVLGHGVTELIGTMFGPNSVVAGQLAPAMLTQIVSAATAIGAAAGATIGIDRGWIRRWFDISEGAVHERDFYEQMAQERAKEVSRLHKIGQNELRENGISTTNSYTKSPETPLPIEAPATMQDTSKPQATIHADLALHAERIGKTELERA